MIFVTVGTHEQQFDRLISYIDELKKKGVIKEKVVMQTGFSQYKPLACEWKRLYSYQEMVEYVNMARIVITHGGPSSFMMPLQIGKIPIVVPRQKKYDEHINDHQVEFTNAVAMRQKNILLVNEIDKLEETIKNYDILIEKITTDVKNNNKIFNRLFDDIIKELFR